MKHLGTYNPDSDRATPDEIVFGLPCHARHCDRHTDQLDWDVVSA